MLNKLIKYDLEYVYKVMGIFYILSILFGVITRILFGIESSFIINIVAQICSGITISMIVNILINNLMRLWVRFKYNFYGDESYLTHTLPVDKKILYLSKIFSTCISLFTSMVVIGLTLFVAYYSKENILLVKNILLPIVNMYDSSILIFLIDFLFVFFLEFLNIIQVGYTGMIIGYKKNNNKLILSVLYGFVIYILTQLFSLFIMFIFALFNRDMMNLFVTNDLINIDMVKMVVYLSIFIYTILPFIISFINIRLFNSGVNVE